MLGFIKNLLFGKKTYDFYLCGPMRGYKDLNKSMFTWAAMVLRASGFTLWNPSENDSYLKSSFAQCMTADLNAVINECRNIVLLPGWRKSLGANMEVFVAFACGKSAVELIPNEYQTGFELIPLDCSNYHLPYENGERRKFDPHVCALDSFTEK
jgi:hypothetical protein